MEEATLRSWDVAGDLPSFDARDLMSAERAELLRLLEQLDDAAWSAPTVCAGWSVHDVTLHLLGSDLGRLSSRRDGHTSPTAAKEPDFGALAGSIERANEEWVSATRRISPRLVVELLAFTGRLLEAHLAQLDPQAEGVPVTWTGAGPSPYWLDIAREYTERWTHQQQICDAVGRPGLRERRWLHPVLDAFMRSLPRAYEAVTAVPGATVVVQVTGDAGGRWALRRGEARWHLVSPEVRHPDAQIRMPDDVAWRLLTRLMSVADALPSIETRGEPTLADPASRAVAVMTTRL